MLEHRAGRTVKLAGSDESPAREPGRAPARVPDWLLNPASNSRRIATASLLQSARALEAREGRRAIATALTAPSWISAGCAVDEEFQDDILGDIGRPASEQLDRGEAFT